MIIASESEVFQITYWVHAGAGLRSFLWHLLTSKASLYAQMVGMNLLMIPHKSQQARAHDGVLGLEEEWPMPMLLGCIKTLVGNIRQV